MSSDFEDALDGTSVTRRDLLRGGAAVGAGIALAGAFPGLASAAERAAAVSRGGRLRVGMTGGGNTETLNPFKVFNEIDLARTIGLYEKLVTLDRNGRPVNQLASGFSASRDATVWKIKLRSDVRWHDGTRLTADDVVYTLRFIATKANNAAGYPDYAFIKPRNIRRLDQHTVELRLDAPNAIVPTILSARSGWIVKAGTKNFSKPVGTGPWRFKSFKAGQRSLFVANKEYRRHGGPYLNELEYITFSDPTAKFNALQGGQIDAMDLLDPKLVRTVEANNRLKVLRARSGFWIPLTMSVDTPPFDDNRVREAFRLMCDRKQMVANALLGQGRVGNDLFCPIDPDYADELPQRAYDPERARALLKAAGAENLRVSLYTSEAVPGMLESATLFVEQAKKAGVTVTLDKAPADQYYGDSGKYLKAAFAQSGWSYRALTTQMAQAVESTAIYNETHWKRPGFDRLVSQARQTLNPAKRRDLWFAAQKMLYDEGGYIIWGFGDQLDAYSAKVMNLKGSAVRALGYYDFTDVWLG